MALPEVAVSLSDYNSAVSDFNSNYSLLAGGPVVPAVLSVSWPAFQTAVEVDGGISAITQIALTFIHRFDGTNWFLTMEVNEMNLTSGAIVATGNRFDILPSGAISTSSFTGTYDPLYFTAVLYQNKPMSTATNVNNFTFPYYQQVSELVCQNNLSYSNEAVTINFASCAFDYTTLVPTSSLVDFPHSAIIYLSQTGHGNYLDDAAYVEMFTNRGADINTLCPPSCGCYVWPAGLPTVATCRTA